MESLARKRVTNFSNTVEVLVPGTENRIEVYCKTVSIRYTKTWDKKGLKWKQATDIAKRANTCYIHFENDEDKQKIVDRFGDAIAW